MFLAHSLQFAILKNSRIKLDKSLRGFKWKFIPYIKPGIELSKLLLKIKSKEDNVFILQNHGLVVCGDDLDEIKKLLSNKGDTEINLVVKNKNKQARYSLQQNRKFDLNHLKALKAKKYVEKITV